jgi:hypothetical protein
MTLLRNGSFADASAGVSQAQGTVLILLTAVLSREIELPCVWGRWFSGIKSARCAQNQPRSTLVSAVTLARTSSLCDTRTIVVQQRSPTPALNHFRLDAIVNENFAPLLCDTAAVSEHPPTFRLVTSLIVCAPLGLVCSRWYFKGRIPGLAL